MMKLFIIILINIALNRVHTTSSSSCPYSCTCSESYVCCTEDELYEIPDFNNLEITPAIIDLSGHDFTVIQHNSFNFTKKHEVIEMYLNSSGIAVIESDAFETLANLQELYLGDNYLKSVPEFMIATLTDLIVLEMSNNYFVSKMPTIRSDSLEVLAMANSKISHVPLDALKHLPNLKVLLLQRNNIQTLKTEVFYNYAPKSLTVKLSYNAWKCDCNLLKTFRFLTKHTFLDSSEPFNCQTAQNHSIDMFKHARLIQNMTKDCHNKNELKLYYPTKTLKHQEKWTDMLMKKEENNNVSFIPYNQHIENYPIETFTVKYNQHLVNCSNMLRYEENTLHFTLFIFSWAMLISFVFGFMAGLLFWKILKPKQFRKDKQASNSRAQLLVAV